VTFSRNGAKAILEIASEVLAGELAAKQGDYDTAIARLHRAVLLEDILGWKTRRGGSHLLAGPGA
jgi:hypothetical protein